MRKIFALWGNVKQSGNLVYPIGCQVTHDSEMTYNVGASTYPIKGIEYSAGATQVTLNVPDDNYDRIDVIYGDNTGAVGKITGIASENPLHPTINPETQYELSFIIVKARSYYITTRWVTTTYGSCVMYEFNNTGYQNVTQKEQQKVGLGDWTDTGNTRQTVEYNPAACPIPSLLQAHAHVSVDPATYDYDNEVSIPAEEGVFHQISSPTKEGFNFMFLSIRGGKTLTVLNAMNVDISNQFVAVSTDIRSGYFNNTIYKLVNAFGTSIPATFYIKIS